MNLDLPAHLHSTRDLLMASVKAHPSEKAPALPSSLLEDLTRHSASQMAPASCKSSAGFFEAIRSMFASPAFGAAAAAIMVLGVASTMMFSGDAPSDNGAIRGSSAYAPADTAQVILISAPHGMQATLESATDFEDGVFFTAPTVESTTDMGARVIVDFSAGTITGIDASGATVYQSSLPESTSGLSLEIASALTRL